MTESATSNMFCSVFFLSSPGLSFPPISSSLSHSGPFPSCLFHPFCPLHRIRVSHHFLSLTQSFYPCFFFHFFLLDHLFSVYLCLICLSISSPLPLNLYSPNVALFLSLLLVVFPCIAHHIPLNFTSQTLSAHAHLT